MSDLKRYNYMENTLNKINSQFISLPDDQVKRNNKILESVLTTFINKMKEKDPLFKAMYSRVFYGGSYYDGLRVGKPEEFDLDLLLKLPKFADPVLTTSNAPGFVHLQLKNLDGWLKQPGSMPTYRNLGNLLDDKKFLQTQKVLAWMEGVVNKTMNDFPQQGSKRVLQNSNGVFQISLHKGGPALTLKIEGSVCMDVDLVACFVFGEQHWPKEGFKANPVKSKPDFFIVPKKPKSGNNDVVGRYWRLSFQEQERVLMDNKRTLKPSIKLLKKLRDSLNHKPIASYYIKTAVLHIVDAKNDEFWRNSFSYVFMTILTEYKNNIENKKIPYYWNRNNNLIGGVNPAALTDMANRLNHIIKEIEKNANDPLILPKYILNKTEYAEFSMARLTL